MEDPSFSFQFDKTHFGAKYAQLYWVSPLCKVCKYIGKRRVSKEVVECSLS